MSLMDELRKKLDSNLFTAVTDALGDDFDYDVVPRTRLNKVIKQRNEWREAAEDRSSINQQEDHSQGQTSEDDFDLPNGKGKQKQPTIEELRQQFEAEKNKELNALKIRYAGLDMLRKAGAVDPELAFSLLDTSKITAGEDGKWVGFDDQITAMKESKPYLYPKQDDRDNTPGGTGKQGGGSDQFAKVKGKADFLKLSVEEQLKFKEVHPEVFRNYLNS